MEHRASEKYTPTLASYKKKTNKRNLSESDLEDDAADFPRFIVIESLEEVCLAKFSPFLREKVISTRATPKNVKEIWKRNLLVEVESQRRTESLLKLKTFHTTKCKAYPHEKLNISKGVIRSRELALATEEKMSAALGKHGSKMKKKIRKEERIETSAYIQTFNQPYITKEVKIDCCVERVEQYVPAPLIWTLQGSL